MAKETTVGEEIQPFVKFNWKQTGLHLNFTSSARESTTFTVSTGIYLPVAHKERGKKKPKNEQKK